MKGKTIVALIAFLILGAIGAYVGAYFRYQPILTSYEAQLSSLSYESSRLNQVVSEKDIQITSLRSEGSKLQLDLTGYQGQVTDLVSRLSSLQNQISNLEQQVSSLKSQESSLQSQISNLKGQESSLQSQISNLKAQESALQSKLNKVMGINVTQQYNWTYRLSTWKWDLPIPLSLYVEYLERQRPLLVSSYVDMAKDPKDDLYIDNMIQKVNEAAIAKGFSELQKINFMIAFIQNLPYTVDIEVTAYNEYPRYPVETLFDRGGDCEDTSILAAALLDRMGYDVVLLHLKDAKHMAVGISLAGTYGSYYEYMGRKYYYLETTGDGWEVGVIPPSIIDRKAFVYPVRS